MPPLQLKARLSQRLDGARRIAVLGVGSTLRGDDAAGVIAARALSAQCAHNASLAVFIGETVPENFTGPIKAFKPSHLVIIDAADMGKPPGHVAVLEPAQTSGITCSTHSLPLHVLAGYLASGSGCDTVIIGIQPANCELGAPVARGVKRAARNVAKALVAIADIKQPRLGRGK